MNNFKKFISIFLSAVIILSTLFMFSAATAFSAVAGISYSFTNSKAGYAEGTITVTPTSENYGTYYLYWADDTKALDGYSEIAALSISSGSESYTMPAYTAIPADATKVIAVKSDSEPDVDSLTVDNASAVYAIPASKQLTFGSTDMLYSFGAISDPQIANDSYGSNSYPYDETHWAAALETLAKRGVDFTISSGDTVNDQNGNKTYAAEYKRYQKILADSSYANPIYEANGNHDVWADPDTIGIPTFIKETGLDSDESTISAKKPYFEITEPTTGDHFIFMALEGTFYTNQGTQFTTAQLDWLESLLEKYHNDGKNIFIIEHANIEGWGSGDKESAPYYYDLGLKKDNSDVKRFINLMETYKECVVVTGHTHLELGAQLNYSDNNGTSAIMMHNSAIGGVRRLVNGSINRSAVLGLTEGYIVEVYKDCIIFNGTNLYYNEIMPSCSYIIPFSTSAISDEPTTTSPEVIEYMYGDTDLSGNVNIQDATVVQYVVAQLSTLESEKAFIQADVNSNGKIDIQDATIIQMYVAKLITEFGITQPVSTSSATSTVSSVNESNADLSETLTLVKEDLDAYYTYSSYDQYMSLKKAYLEYKDANLDTAQQNNAVSDLTLKQEKLYAIAGSRPSESGGEITVYFTNNYEWSTVKAYVWGSAGKITSWPGTNMTYKNTNSLNQEIYSITFNYEDYQNIIFTNGSQQTVDIALSGDNNIGYYISGESGGKLTCSTYIYS